MARLLIVDDDPGTLTVLTECLQFEDFEVQSASELGSAVDLLRHEPSDLILTDLFRSSFSPAALTDLQAYTHAAPGIPIVVATAHAEAGQCDASAYGLVDIILKSFALDDLLARVRRVLETQGQVLEGLKATSDDAWARLQVSHHRIGESAQLLRQIQNPQQTPTEP